MIDPERTHALADAQNMTADDMNQQRAAGVTYCGQHYLPMTAAHVNLLAETDDDEMPTCFTCWQGIVNRIIEAAGTHHVN